MTNTIEINDVGPIDHVSIPVPAGGGVVVLRGANGSGKSTAIAAVDDLSRGGSRLATRARHGKAQGSVEGLGVRLSVGRVKASRKGELQVEAFEPRVSVASLVDPGIKDPEIADRYRVATCCALADIKPDVDQFRALADVRWSEGAFDGEDLLTIAARVRGEINAAALQAERRALETEAECAAILATIGEVDEALDVDVAQTLLEESIGRKASIESEARSADDARGRIEAARATLAAIAEVDSMPSKVPDIERQIADLNGIRADLVRRLAETDRDIAELKRELASEASRVASAEAAIAARAAAEQAIAEASMATAGPSADDVQAAGEAVAFARQRLAAALDMQKSRKRMEDAKRAQAASEEAAKLADRLRAAAARTDDVLSAHLAGVMPQGLRVLDGRLVLDRGGRVVPFGELSDGERWRIALDIAIDAMGTSGIVAIEQAAWEGLDGPARKAVHQHAIKRGVTILTAEADHGEVGNLRAEVMT